VQQKVLPKVRRTSAIVPHRHDSEKGFLPNRQYEADLSARLAQTGRRDTHRQGLAQNFDQHHVPTLAVSHLVDALDSGKRRFGQSHALASLEQSLGFSLNRCLLAALELDEEWFRAKLRLAMDINSRDGIIDLGADVWHLGDARSAPLVLARTLMIIWLEPTILDRVRVKDGNIRVIAPQHRETRGEPLGHGVEWLSLEERFAFYGVGITYTPVTETAGMSVAADPTTPVFGPFSADFRWVTLLKWPPGLIRCTDGQVAIFKALLSFKGEPMTAEPIMERAGLDSDKLIDIFKVKPRDRDKPEAEGPNYAYDALVSRNRREGLYWMPSSIGLN
jgi:hypothetical protein